MATFAKDTTVSADRTLEEIRATIKRYKAVKLATFEDENRVGVAFEMENRRVRFVMPLPDKTAGMVKINASRQTRYSEPAYEQAVRTRWRALLLTIKAKLESVQSGIETFDEAFMAQLVLPDNRTMAEWAKPQIDAAYRTGEMPPMLPSGS